MKPYFAGFDVFCGFCRKRLKTAILVLRTGMGISSKIKSAVRGNVSFATLTREVWRRRQAERRRAFERKNLQSLTEMPARLAAPYSSYSPKDLRTHYYDREKPAFWLHNNFKFEISNLKLADGDINSIVAVADAIVSDSTWELAGFGAMRFDGEGVWRRDPMTGEDWGLDHHADVVVYRDGGPDIRILWELNRLGHVVPLACAFSATYDEKYAETFFSHVESWIEQNPYGRGANWNCAMEVALRAVNLLAAFDIFRRSAACDEKHVAAMLRLYDQHGRFVEDNNEFSYLATSNHYLSNVVGLFWIGTLLPELEHAAHWREFGLREILHEMDVQILPDGADFEASTGYHAFVAQMLLYTFILADRNGVEIDAKYRDKLRGMFTYLNGIIRPDGRMPLIGDADGSQIVPIVRRDADDQKYLLDVDWSASILLASVREDADDHSPEAHAGGTGVGKQGCLPSSRFPDAGSYVMREGDLYLLFNTNDCGVNGRGSHAHSDALSIEVSACGRAFIIDPGSYVYNFDREARHLFRSTAYHSTVMIDGAEQNRIERDLPFIMRNDARPRVLEWETGSEFDRVSAEHYGYQKLSKPVIHRRTIYFDKRKRSWRFEDSFHGEGEHEFTFSFHLAPGIKTEIRDGVLRLGDESGSLAISGFDTKPEIVAASRSINYGHKQATQIVRWRIVAAVPFTFEFAIAAV